MSQATPTQRAVIESRGQELAVAAGAGSGKTSTLIRRIIGLITGVHGETPPDSRKALELTSLLIVTFTRAAAAELRERVDDALAKAIDAHEQSLHSDSQGGRQSANLMLRHLRRQRTLLPLAHISTIHSFCQRVINQYGAAQGLSAEHLLTDEDAVQLKHQLATRFLDRQLGREDDTLLRELALAWGGRDGVGPSSLAGSGRDAGLRALLLKLHSFQQGLLDPQAWWAEQMAATELSPQRFNPEHPLVAGLLAEFAQWRDAAIVLTSEEAAALSREHPDAVHLEYATCRQQLLAQVKVEEDWASPVLVLQALSAKCDGKEGRRKLPYSQLAISAYRRDIDKSSPWYERLAQNSEWLKGELSEWLEIFSEPWLDVAQRENTVRSWLNRLWQLGLDFETEYRKVKQLRQVQDFNDLERDALALLAADVSVSHVGEVIPSQIALELRGTFQEVLVDEYQDVNRLQDAILRLVTPDLPDGAGQARVVVGDIKQSIYGFRQAEPEIFRALVSRLDTVAVAGSAASTFRLRENFRSRPEILTAINALMDGLFTDSLGGEDYSASGALVYGGSFGAESDISEPGHARLHLVLDSADVDDSDSGNTADSDESTSDDSDGSAPGTDEKAYHHLARRLREVYLAGQEETGFLVERGTGVRRPICWDDLVVLLRSRTGLSILRIILEQAGIPAQVPSSGSYFDQPDVQDALMLLRAVASPYDDLAQAACLRGPMGKLTSEELLIVLHGAAELPERHEPVFDKLAAFLSKSDTQLPYSKHYIEALQERLQAVLRRLEGWRKAAVRQPVAAIIWQVMSEANLLVSASSAPYGEQRSANLFELHDRALEYDAAGRYGLARFLEYLSSVQASAHDSGEFPAAVGAGAVRIMTVHQAKGLEFPCVFLPYVHRRFNEQDLRQQVLISNAGGLAGQHLDMSSALNVREQGDLPALPRRTPSLGFRQVKRLLQQQQAAEELRLMYVALTRAQERLELFTVLKPGEVEAVMASQQSLEPHKARRPWDWVRRQLGEVVGRALKAEMGTEIAGRGGWLVSQAPAPETEAAGEAERRGWGAVTADSIGPYQLSEVDKQQLSARLEYSYPWEGSTQLPVKATITGIAKHAEPAGVRPEVQPSAAMQTRETHVVIPTFMSETKAISSLRHGSEVHSLLSLLDVTQEQTEASIHELWARQNGAEYAQQYAAKASDMQRDIAKSFGPLIDAVQARELPVTMAVPSSELPGLLDMHQIELAACHPSDWVLVQGVLDLLLRWPERAVVLDYKTDHGLDAAALKERYAAQLLWYARAVHELWPKIPEDSITCAIYALNGPGLVIL